MLLYLQEMPASELKKSIRSSAVEILEKPDEKLTYDLIETKVEGGQEARNEVRASKLKRVEKVVNILTEDE